jgi:hypothetical protein
MTLAGAVILILIGTVWILQGFDVAFAPKSFMTGDRWWVLWGGVAILAGLALLWRGVRRPPSGNDANG